MMVDIKNGFMKFCCRCQLYFVSTSGAQRLRRGYSCWSAR